MKLRMLAGSDTGIARAVNEDFCGIFEEQGLAIVCDGMGGHNAGANASRLAVMTIRYMYLFLDPSLHQQITKDLEMHHLEMASRLIGSIRLTNRNIYHKSLQNPEWSGMGTTVSALLLQHNLAIIAHVGDSRIYRIRGSTITRLTQDHTWVNELIQDQEIDSEAAQKFEKKNVITRALGLSGTIKIDAGIEPVQAGDLFLICTDGLTRALSDDEIKRIVLFNQGNLEHSLTHLIDTATMKDGSDNITVALVAVDEIETSSNHQSSSYVTLKEENKQLTMIEDRILDRELYRRTDSEETIVPIKKIWRQHRNKFAVSAGLFGIGIILVWFFWFNYWARPSAAPIHDLTAVIETTSAPVDTIRIASTALPKLNPTINRHGIEIESKTIPDSVIKKMNNPSKGSQTELPLVTKIQSWSLQRNLGDQGKIFITGLEKINLQGDADVFINNNFWGKSSYLSLRGVSLKPGTYTITIRDSTDRVLFHQENITVSAGDIKAIEIKSKRNDSVSN
ncbi:MAG: protein phosphatase 2C domain-containing protein [candidate division KSB1 bacterium]|nr:protein phosphatase 2C domain-containing protein [candidate division KSB1 bacterium]MDZ7358544.1 protein phosphatase 2C domain-containing protein [candidate division KSB1 bacterium]MDZ7376122.1 protein phosphatase 2C domain-containing protein [candidate division KSB1 bacterium]MDZ7401515.1 protein phosphatase 2C domain-containing protein [candidate division KSB1 bacterium]